MTLKTLSFREFVRARHEMWLERNYGVGPSTGGVEVLRPHHYTNLWRELDRGTIYLFNKVQRPRRGNPVELIKHTVLYRAFNVRETYDAAYKKFGNDLMGRVTAKNLYEFLSARERNFTSAYVRCCDLRLVCEQLADLDDAAAAIAVKLDYGLADEARAAISGIYSFGSFTGDQLMMDLCWEGGPFSVAYAPKFGPGARRGLAYCEENGYGGIGELLEAGGEEIPEARRPTVHGFPVAYDIRTLEHTLCELSKHVKFQNKGDRQVKMRPYRSGDDSPAGLPWSWRNPAVIGTPDAAESKILSISA